MEEIFWNKIYTVRNRVIAHLIFWVIYAFFLHTAYQRYDGNFAHILVGKDLIAVLGIFYTTAYIIMPKWILKGKFLKSLLWAVACYLWWCLLTYFMCLYVDEIYAPQGPYKRYIDIVIANSWYAFLTPGKISFYLLDFSFMIALPVGLKLMQSFVMQAIKKSNLERDNLLLELNFLKSQINPHFLFNSLNNIYRMVNKNDHRTGDTVLSLANLMRYTLYESNEPFVKLTEEITFIQHYIDLQRLRYGNKVTINVELPSRDTDFKIAPLILFPFIENAFKHGPEKSQREAWVGIKMTIKNSQLICVIENSVSKQASVTEVGGVGVINSKKRLALNYRKKHELEVKETSDSYRVSLTIMLA